jgi:hypothetical protein
MKIPDVRHTSIFVYPWDIIDYGTGRYLDLVRSLGLDGVHVAVNYHHAKLLCTHNPVRTLYFPEPNACYFTPQNNRYPPGLVPEESTLTSGTSFLSELVEETEKRGVERTAWIICMHNSTAGFQNPELTVTNVFGEHIFHSLCPANPDAQGIVLGMVQDVVSRFGFQSLCLESAGFMRFFHGYHHEMYGFPLTDSLDLLLSLCFCPSCKQTAEEDGIDSNLLQAAVKRHIEKWLKGSRAEENKHDGMNFNDLLGELFHDIPLLEDYLCMRKNLMNGWVRSLRSAAGDLCTLSIIATPIPPAVQAGIRNGADPVSISEIADRVTICGYYRLQDEISEDIDALIRDGLRPDRAEVVLRPQYPDTESYQNLVSKINTVQEHGISHLCFYNFGQMPQESLQWIRKGIRETKWFRGAGA